jgi:ADP-ribose pyrophosphatase YjhB (NUDIX family)
MLMKLVGRAWKLMPRGMRTWLARRAQPKFTVSAGGIITNEESEVLLLDHVLRPASGWGVPGGFLAAGEQPEAAFRREVMEETGLELKDVRLYRMRTLRRHIEIIYLAEGVGEARVLSREIKRLGWFAVEDMPPEMGLDQQFLIRRALTRDE